MYQVMFGPITHAKFISWAKDRDEAINQIVNYVNKHNFKSNNFKFWVENGITTIDVGVPGRYGYVWEVKQNG